MKLFSSTILLLLSLVSASLYGQGLINPPVPATSQPGSFADVTVNGVSGTTFAAGNVVWLSTDPNSTAGAFQMTFVNVIGANQLTFRVPCGVPTGTYFILVQGGGGWNGNPWPDPVTNGGQLTIGAPLAVCSAIPFDCSNTTYSQNFNSMTPTTNGVCPANPLDPGPGNMVWTNGVTIPGWHVTVSGFNRFYSMDGNCDLQCAYNYGNNGSPDRALGGIGGAVGQPAFGVNFRNDGTAPITQLAVSFVREHWRRAQTATDRTPFEYSTSATSLSSGTWTAVTQLDLVPNYATPQGPLDGNLPANRASISHTITGLNILPGQQIWFRWLDEDTPGGFDDGLAVDDFSVTATYGGGAAVGTLTGANTVCAGNPSGILTLGGSGGTVVRWESAPTIAFAAITTIANATNTLNPGTLAATTCYRVVVNTGACAEALSNVVCAAVDPCTNSSVNSVNPTTVDLCSPQRVTITGLSTTFLSATNVFLSTDPTNLVGGIPMLNLNAVSNTEMSFDVEPTTPAGTYHIFVEGGGTQVAPPSAFPASIQFDVTGSAFVAGTVTPANLTVCAGANAGILTLTGYTGPVIRWEASPDNFATPANITAIANATDTELFNNLTDEVWYRAVVGDPTCTLFSTPIHIEIDPSSIGGEVFTDQVICGTSADGSLILVGTSGTVIRWEWSTDDFVTVVNPIANDQPIHNYTNITETTQFRAVTSSGVCDAVSDFATVTVQLPPDPGTAGNDTLVCMGTNTVNLRLTGHNGDIVRWESSTDGFVTDITPISLTDAEITVTDVPVPTQFRAVVTANGLCEEFSIPAVVSMDPLGVAGSVGPDMTFCGLDASGTLELTGLQGPVVRWEYSIDNTFQFKENVFVTTRTYTFNRIQRSYCYRAVVSLDPTCGETVTNPTCIELIRTEGGGMVSPNLAICKGAPVNHTMTLTGNPGPILRWESYNDCRGFTDPTPIAQTLPTLTVTSVDTTTCYRAVIEDPLCPMETYSAHATISVSNIQLAPVVTAPSGCATLGRIVPNGTGGTLPVLLYSVQPSIVPPSFQNLIDRLPSGEYRLIAFDAAANCRKDTLLTVPFDTTVAKIDVIRDLTTNSATLEFSGPPVGPQPRYNLRYRIAGQETWTLVFNIPFLERTLTGLQNNTEYEAQIQYVCTNGNRSDWASDTTFTTLSEGDCSTLPVARPGGVYVRIDDANTVTVHWNLVPGTKGYLVSVGLASLSPNGWPTYLACDPDDSLIVKGLVPGRVYRARLRTHCPNCTTNSFRDVSPWTDLIQFAMPIQRIDATPTFSSNPQARMEVYPNPTRDRFTLRLTGVETAETAEVQLFDLAGRRLLGRTVNLSEGASTIDLPDGVASGLYLLRVRTAHGEHATRLIVE